MMKIIKILFMIYFIFYSISYANTRDGLGGWWKLDETGSSLFDSSWKGNKGTATGTTFVNNCVRNNCRNFNGSSDYIDVGKNSSIQPAVNTATISFWIKPTDNNSTISGVVSTEVTFSTNNGYNVFKYSDGNIYCDYGNGTTSGRVSITYSANVWTHFVCTYNGTTITPYKNGVVGSTSAFTGNLAFGTGGNTFIGAFGNFSGFYSGNIDDVRIYNRSLTQQEVNDLYNAGMLIKGNPRLNYVPGT